MIIYHISIYVNTYIPALKKKTNRVDLKSDNGYMNICSQVVLFNKKMSIQFIQWGQEYHKI